MKKPNVKQAWNTAKSCFVRVATGAVAGAIMGGALGYMNGSPLHGAIYGAVAGAVSASRAAELLPFEEVQTQKSQANCVAGQFSSIALAVLTHSHSFMFDLAIGSCASLIGIVATKGLTKPQGPQ